MNSRELEKFKHKLRRKYSKEGDPICISVDEFFEVFLWNALSHNEKIITNEIGQEKCAIYLAYEYKHRLPTEDELLIDVKINTSKVSFEKGIIKQNWRYIFGGISVRAVEFGDLPCESITSQEIFKMQIVREFEVVAFPRFGEIKLNPLRITLTG